MRAGPLFEVFTALQSLLKIFGGCLFLTFVLLCSRIAAVDVFGEQVSDGSIYNYEWEDYR